MHTHSGASSAILGGRPIRTGALRIELLRAQRCTANRTFV